MAKNKGLNVEVLDLRRYDIQMCNWKKIEEYNNDMNLIKEKVESADFYVLAYPIYNYSFSWVCKNFIDIFSYYMDSKKCGIIQNSYSARSFSDWYGELAKILWLHNNVSLTLPMIHTCNEDFEWNELIWGKSIEKMEWMLNNLCN
jgi:multimeric flavodoxin WrbA